MRPETIRRRLVVTGHVQGVFFRDATRESAQRQGVSGWVSNRDDGAVEVVLEGPQAAVQAVVEFCRRGPPQARVDSVEQLEETPEGVAGFEVR